MRSLFEQVKVIHDAAGSDQGVSFQTYRSDSLPTSKRYKKRAWSGCFTECFRTQVPQRGSRMGMAVDFSGSPTLY